ncbi:IS1595 family transposase [Sphingomonas daechungensis]|uniref:IS1595 family transposase n=1 Tax=Sphingomonas daechungensis TaxID=1176646 RepID=UPI0031EDDB4B
MSKAPTLRQFQDRFPTEDSCLDHLFQVRYAGTDCPKCGRPVKYSRVKGRRSYQCQWCANNLYPTAGTPFDRTRTSLRDWFYVMFLFTTTRNGVAAKKVQRDIGVTYKTAWRMCHEVRKYMGMLDSNDPLGGVGETVQIDETYIGGKSKADGTSRMTSKHVVMGMLECGGELITKVVPGNSKHQLLPVVQEHVLPGTTVHTDTLRSYMGLKDMGYRHDKVNHTFEYVSKTGCHTNTIEGFWNILKRGINGTHIHVSAKHLPKYLGEFEYRWNMRDVPHLMLDRLMFSFTR